MRAATETAALTPPPSGSPSPSTTTTLAWGINNRRADPFDALPIPGSPEIDSVIQYCKPTPPPHRPPR